MGSCPDTDIDLRFFSSMPFGVPSSLEVKEKGMSDGLLHSFYAVFEFLRRVNQLQADWLVKMDFAQEWVQQFHLL